jgi:DNA adenine methylase
MGEYICNVCNKKYKQKKRFDTHMQQHNVSNDVSLLPTLVKHLSLKKISCLDEMSSNKITKPILKWVGGKTQIMNDIIGEFPTEMNNYREIFLGGGSVLITLLTYVKNEIIKINGSVYAFDLNEPLIYMYKNIQTNHDALYDEIQQIITEFNNCGNGEINRTPLTIDEAIISKENYYYWIRHKYNLLTDDDKKSIIGSAMFIFLNKTCFRGVFRIGPNGFNVPYGHYANPEIINKKHLDELHHLIQGVIFECDTFKNTMNNVCDGDFTYVDPPYAPETSTSFVKYTENGFNMDDHNYLFNIIHHMTDVKQKMLMSNADVKLIRDNFGNDGRYTITPIVCRRRINSKNPTATVTEVIIKNY